MLTFYLTLFLSIFTDAEDEDKTVSVMLDGEESFLSFVDGLSEQVCFNIKSML